MIARTYFKKFIIILLIKLQLLNKVLCLNCKHIISDLELCNPYLLCRTVGEGCKVNNPYDCQSYYQCEKKSEGILPTGNSIRCPDDQYFNFTEQGCVVGNNPCVHSCNILNCNYFCNDTTFELYENEKFSCSLFYKCLTVYQLQNQKEFSHNNSLYFKYKNNCCDICNKFHRYCGEGLIGNLNDKEPQHGTVDSKFSLMIHSKSFILRTTTKSAFSTSEIVHKITKPTLTQPSTSSPETTTTSTPSTTTTASTTMLTTTSSTSPATTTSTTTPTTTATSTTTPTTTTTTTATSTTTPLTTTASTTMPTTTSSTSPTTTTSTTTTTTTTTPITTTPITTTSTPTTASTPSTTITLTTTTAPTTTTATIPTTTTIPIMTTTTTTLGPICSDMADEIKQCDPLFSCNVTGAGCKIYDPLDCHNYFLCVTDANGQVKPSDNPVQCPDNNYFNFSSQECEREMNSCTQPCINHNCTYTCPAYTGSITLIADSHNCSLYYACGSGEPFSFQCDSQNSYFNGYNCSDNMYDCCTPCVPYCKIANIETLDPYDCKSFYVCEEIGVPNEDTHFQCPGGQSFNSTMGNCQSTNTTCEALCSA